jgi:hypothetical protein
MKTKPVTLQRTDGGDYVSSDGRWAANGTYVGPKMISYTVVDTLGLASRPPTGQPLAHVRSWIKQQTPLPRRVDVHRIKEGYVKVHTPLGTYTIQRVAFLAGEAGTTGYGTAPHWYRTNPGQNHPDAKTDTLAEALADIEHLVDWELKDSPTPRILAEVASESWRLEHHDDDSTWAPFAKAYFDRDRATRTA